MGIYEPYDGPGVIHDTCTTNDDDEDNINNSGRVKGGGTPNKRFWVPSRLILGNETKTLISK